MENDRSTPAPLSPDHMSDDQMSSDPSKTSNEPLPLLTSANYETADKNVVDAALSLMSRSAAYKEETAMDLVSKDTNQNFVNENLFNGQFAVAPPTVPVLPVPLSLVQPIPLTTATNYVDDPMVASYEPVKVPQSSVRYTHSESVLLKREPGGL